MRWLLVFLVAAVRLTAADLTLAFEIRWAGTAITVPSAKVLNDGGQKLRLTRMAALISEVSLTQVDGTAVRLEGQFGFIDAGSGALTCTFRNVPVGEYSGIAFQFGLTPVVNHADPGQWPAEHPLNPLVNRLHWSWKGGYVFVALEGRWSTEPGPAEERGFSYHLANDQHRAPVRFAAQFSVQGPTEVKLAIDVARTLGAVRMATDDGSESTHSAADDFLATRITEALRRSVFWLGAETVPVLASRPASALAEARPVVRATPLPFTVPSGYPTPSLPADNPLTVEGVALGRMLFVDKRLSGNGTQACIDCHAPALAFGDRVAFSRGAKGEPGLRNAMPLFNLAWSGSYAWDGSKPRVRDQALAAMTNPVEMNADADRVIALLAADDETKRAFSQAFGQPEVTAERVSQALEQYLLTLVSADSKFDRAARGQATLTDQEKEGFALFTTEYDPARGRRGADCFHCHGGALFTDYDFKDNGLDRQAGDSGRGRVTGRGEDNGKFKTPSLRNVALSGPFMHDGRFSTLEEVVAHYDHGVVRSANLDPNLAKHPDRGLELTTAEQQALVAFLKTLTETTWGG